MLRRREGERLAGPRPGEVRGQAETDLPAVQDGTMLRYWNGQSDGHVTNLKLVKRQRDARAKVDLLRNRLLQAIVPSHVAEDLIADPIPPSPQVRE